MKSLRPFFALLFLLLGPARAQVAGPAASLTGADIDRLTSLLQDEGRRAEFLRTLEALAAAQQARAGTAGEGSVPPAPAQAAEGAEASPPARAAQALRPSPAPNTAPTAATTAAPTAAPAASAAAPPEAAAPAPAAPPDAPLIAPNTVGAQLLLGLSGRIGTVSETVLGTIRSMADLPGLWNAVAALARDPVARIRLLDVSWKLLLLLGAGLLAEATAIRALAGLRRRIDTATPRRGAAWTWLRRVPLVVARFVLDLLPIAGLGLVVYGLLGVVRPLPTTQLVGLMAANVYMAARMAFAAARMLLSPGSNQLRLIPCSDAAAAACIGWLRRIMLVGVGGYGLAEAGMFLGLPWAAYDAILNLTLLVISLFLVRIVLQQRAAVAAVLRANPLAPDEAPSGSRLLLRRLRDRLAEIWHVLVILWLGAGWAVWALALENGFQRLLVGTLATLLVAGLAKALDEGVLRLLERALNPGPEVQRRYPGLAPRAAHYVPLLRAAISVAIGAVTVVLLLETWGLGSLDWFAAGTLGSRLLATLLSIGMTLVLALVVWEATNTAIQRRLTRLSRDSQAARSARVRTLLPMLRTVLGGFILVFVVLNALAQLGVNVAPLLAGAGVVGLAIGFGSQTLVRDVITGIFLLLEDAVAVGDVVQLGGLTGVVEHLSIRSIKLRATDGSVHLVPFSAVTTVTNMTRDFAFAVLDITVSYADCTDRVTEELRAISKEIRAEPKWAALIRDDIDVWGIEKLADSGVMMQARVKTEPSGRWAVAREFNRRIKQRFEATGIHLPRPMVMVMVERPEREATEAAAPVPQRA